MNLAGTDLWITFNGEIYNYLELRSQLAGSRKFETDTDTEVLLAAYERWGTDCLARLNGMFALAIWDGRRKRLLLARDRFGEKPLYFSTVSGRFLFASEMKQFFADACFSREPNLSTLADFLLFSIQDHDERTFLAGVTQLLPAHWMEVDAVNGAVNAPRRYWAPSIADDLDTSHDHECDEKLRWLLEDAVRLRLRSDVQVGVCLSGGVDSTAICALMAAQVSDPSRICAYTMSFPSFEDDETDLACKAASSAGVRHKTTRLGGSEVRDELDQFIYYQDGPTGGVPNFASWRVFRAARNDGSVVLLNGQGADELLGGYIKFFFFWFRILLARSEWTRLTREALAYFWIHAFAGCNLQIARRYFPLPIRKKIMGLWRFGRPEFRRHAVTAMDWGSGESLNVRLWKDLSRFSLPCLLHWEDRNSMAARTEARLPFLDHRIAEVVLETSVYTKLKDGFSKSALRKALSSTLPPEVCWQKKKRGFNTPAETWFKTDLRSAMRQLFSTNVSPLGEFFRTDDLLRNYELFLRGDSNTLSHFDWFKLLGTAIWLEQVRSGSVPVPTCFPHTEVDQQQVEPAKASWQP